MTSSSKSISTLLLLLLTTYFEVSSGLQCLNCKWVDVANGDQFNCKAGDVANSILVTENAEQVGYCFTVTGTRNGVANGLRGFHVYTTAEDPKYTQGQCMDSQPINVTLSPSMNDIRSCLCNDKDSCNTGDNSNGAMGRVVLMGILPTVLFSFLVLSL